MLPTLEAFSSNGNNTIAPICQEDGSSAQYAADPYDCNKYFQCSNGEPILKNCDEGLVWDPNSNICSYPWPIGNVNCTEKTNPDPDDSQLRHFGILSTIKTKSDGSDRL